MEGSEQLGTFTRNFGKGMGVISWVLAETVNYEVFEVRGGDGTRTTAAAQYRSVFVGTTEVQLSVDGRGFFYAWCCRCNRQMKGPKDDGRGLRF